MGELGRQRNLVEYGCHQLGTVPGVQARTAGPRATAPAAAPAAPVDLETVVLNRIRTAATPVTADTVYRSLPPHLKAKRHTVVDLIDRLVDSGAVLRTLTNGKYLHTAL